MPTTFGIIEQLWHGAVGPEDMAAIRSYLETGNPPEGASEKANHFIGMIAGSGLNANGVAQLLEFTKTGTNPEGFDEAFALPDHEITSRYGYGAWALAHPELGPLLRQAAVERWDGATIQGELVKTQWWQTRSQSARSWEELKGRDPATAQQQLDNATRSIRVAASRLGFAVDDATAASLAEQSIVNAWQQSDILFALAGEARKQAANPTGGDVAATIGELKRRAGAYFVTLGDDVLRDVAVRIASGSETIDGWTQGYLVPQATSRFNSPAIRDAIAKGVTLAEFFEPARQLLAQTLEMAPDSINLMDARWSKVIESDDGKGNLRPMTLSEVGRFARSQSEWWNTRQANQGSAELASFLEEKTGVRMSGGI